ncbi:receptor-like protein EIX2 [Cynara cardunculus var. scolymus]|uniref:receptor-like protein EIX2 n=1 Tax=Cynara cardunculus var. scolymus TaxID=59895 RepID=UPI000D62E432|nr:receptor-like protein EIX2 [Cynara cardunculus var. scolymus]
MDDERQALLDFKHALIDEANRHASWVPDMKDCCTWTGIVCDNITGHVHSIHLPANEYSKQWLSGHLSPSLLNLKQIRHLDLSGNYFGGIQVPSFMGSLGNLRYLNLSRSGFGGPIPPQLGNLTELRILCLPSFYAYDTNENEYTSMMWLSSLRLLHHLDMSHVDLSKAIDWFQVINTLPSLVELHLYDCQLSHIYPHVPSLNLTFLSVLDLSYNYFTNNFVPRWIFSLTALVSLDLAGCDFHGLIPGSFDGFHNMTSLELLRVPRNNFMSSSLVLEVLSSIGGNLILLDISSCGVSSSVLDFLHNLTSLHSLDMSGNQLTEAIPKSLGNLCSLKHIDLGGNYFPNISLTSLLESLFQCKSPSLESLSLESTGLSCHLPDQLGQLIYLVHFQLGNNSIVGGIPDSIGRLSFLRSLDLHKNLILGPIPYSIGQLSSLEFLDLAYNQLNGSLPDSLGQLSKLNILHLSSNLFTGIVTEAHFAKLTRLEILNGEGNNLILRSCISNWIPSFHLWGLSLSSWDLGPQFPLWLQLHTNLIVLEMSNTRISTTIPESFWKSLPDLQYLDLSQNHIQGMLFGIHAPLVFLNLSSNKFGGELPKLLNSSWIAVLDLSYNSFSGSLYHMLCTNSEKRQQLGVLNMGNNNLSGVIPKCWARWLDLSFINLENNKLFGRIPQTLGTLSSLKSLNLCNNNLSGRLPLSLKKLRNMEIFQLAGNELDGRVPTWLGREFSNLRILNLRSNNFDGHIIDELCYLTIIQILDLADNNLSGNIPKCFDNFSVLSGNGTSSTKKLIYGTPIGGSVANASLVIKGREDTYSNFLGLVMILDLSSNKFSGSIPRELMSLRALQSLNLSRNQLTGRIPENIGDLKLLASFDVSLNQLSVELPVSLSSLSFLSSFNVSYNNLTGRIPSSTQLQSFNESDFLSNELCGDPITKSCVVEVPVPAAGRDQDEEENDGAHGVDWGLIISIVIGFIAGFWIVLAPLIVSSAWRITYFRFLSDVRFMFYDAISTYFRYMFHKY